MTEPSTLASARVAVTGASGFVGMHLLSKLAATGHAVVALSRSGTGMPDVHDVVLSSYADIASVGAALAGVDTVVHLAARAHQDSSSGSDARLFREANVDSALAVAQTCLTVGVRRFVLLSSIGVHGSHTNGRPFTEADAPQPTELYAQSKWQAEQAVADVLAGTATEFVVLRPPLVYGSRAPGNFRRLIGLVRRLPLVPLGGFHRRRSLIHIDNLCDAIERTVWHPGVAGRQFVLCDGDDVSVAEIAHELAIGLGRSPRCVVDVPEAWLHRAALAIGRGAAFDKLAGELRVDASAFRAATGWAPPRRAREALRATASAWHADVREASQGA